jgi:hypothetical protein
MTANPADVMHRLIDVLGLDAALKYAADNGLKQSTSSDALDGGGRDAARAAELAKASSTNPFVKGANFSLKEQGRLYKNPATRLLAVSLAKSAGVTLPENPTHFDLTPEGQRVA